MKKPGKILITGSGGQLGSAFANTFTKNNIAHAAFTRNELDITRFKDVELRIKTVKPDIIINASAYTNVDRAEISPEVSYDVNSKAVDNLAKLCKKYGVFLVHYSTDYVFDGKNNKFYTESDKPNPVNAYGRSKLCGEQAVRNNLTNALIFRVSWVFGGGVKNILYKSFCWAKLKKTLTISADQASVPTYTQEVIRITLLALSKRIKGLYHLTNCGYATRYEMVKYFLGKIGARNIIIPAAESTFSLSAPRPLFCAMSNAKIQKCLKIKIPHWQNAIDRYARLFHNA